MNIANIKDLIKTAFPNKLLIHRLPSNTRNSILLTFDDGPEDVITPQILEQLDQFNARAIFFVVGEQLEKYPHIANLIVSKGHLLGNHTYSHPNPTEVTPKQYQNDIIKCQKLIQKITGKKNQLYRPPLGIISLSGLYFGYKTQLTSMLWSNEGGEWGVNKQDTPSVIGNRLIQNLQPRDILLLHDDNKKVPEILDIILPTINKRGIDLYCGIKSLPD